MLVCATFGAGCFWGVQRTFDQIPGVISTLVGYSGGDTPNPSYQSVCTGQTGHIEVVQLSYDAEKVAYTDLLAVFWESHNPTSLDKQGLDAGRQYRSVIFYHDESQHKLATESKKQLDESRRFDKPIVTDILSATTFYEAEDYHQKYLNKQQMR